MYFVKLNGEWAHNQRIGNDCVLIEPTLTERINTHGSFEFQIAPNNPCYDSIKPRVTKVEILSDTKNARPWFGRVMEVSRAFNNCKRVYCEGELGCLTDVVYQPFGFKGSPEQLFTNLMTAYADGNTDGYDLKKGNVTVTDPNHPNQFIVRSSKYPMPIWAEMTEKLFESTLGGYIMPRYDKATGNHYVDYLEDFTEESTQKIEFGKNILDFEETVSGQNIVTCLIPFGAELQDSDPGYAPDPPENGTWNGNMLTVESVNGGSRIVENQDGINIWGRVYGYEHWDDVTIAQNLLKKARQKLAELIAESISLELYAVDLAYVDVNVDQIHCGMYVPVESKPHNLKLRLLCTEKTTPLTRLEESVIILGAGRQTITDLQAREMNK